MGSTMELRPSRAAGRVAESVLPWPPLPPHTEQQLRQLGAADIVVGIPSYNNARTIGHVVRAAQAGLTKYFPGARGVIINSDGGSQDGTPQAVLEATLEETALVQAPYRVYPVHKLSLPYPGTPGKGSAFRTIFLLAQCLGAKAVAVVDADLRSITPQWIELLAGPVLERDFDLVAPLYMRHKYDGTITNSIVYPLTRALYGKRIRQPIGGDFGFSPRLVAHYLRQDVWETDVARFGIDIWVTTQAVAHGFRVCQAFLGAKIHDPKDPASDLSAMLAQVLSALFTEMERNAATWKSVSGSEPVPTFGFRFEVATEPVTVNVRRMLESFRLGCRTLREIWEPVIGAESLAHLQALACRPEGRLEFADDLWAGIVYDFAVAFHRRTVAREHLLRALTPLYLGWVASFVTEMQPAGAQEVEERLERLCLTYEALKPALISRWDETG
ncbi:MAG: cell wall biosynthesis glycosyltransferase [Bryobacterales bacterium]|nr:cell wall biosynthesis glycosyltransferase [Bryobacteraceae bacterium]MDW8353664.1 cell wall biosynthesis glycosyltransferase [Bryobacterales bacterium]